MSMYDNLSNAGKTLYQKVAAVFGADNIILTSTLRNRNDKSQHNVGDAFDFKVRGLSNSEVFDKLRNSGINYNQLINEISGPRSSGPHIHIGAGTGNENLVYVNGRYVPAGNSPNPEPSIFDEGPLEQWVNKNLWGLEPGDLSLTNGLGRIVAIVIGVILIGLAIAAFVFKNETATKIVEAVKPA